MPGKQMRPGKGNEQYTDVFLNYLAIDFHSSS